MGENGRIATTGTALTGMESVGERHGQKPRQPDHQDQPQLDTLKTEQNRPARHSTAQHNTKCRQTLTGKSNSGEPLENKKRSGQNYLRHDLNSTNALASARPR